MYSKIFPGKKRFLFKTVFLFYTARKRNVATLSASFINFQWWSLTQLSQHLTKALQACNDEVEALSAPVLERKCDFPAHPTYLMKYSSVLLHQTATFPSSVAPLETQLLTKLITQISRPINTAPYRSKKYRSKNEATEHVP